MASSDKSSQIDILALGDQMTESGKELLSHDDDDDVITDIPLEIFTDEILARIPAKNLHSSFKPVCKDWLHLISSPGFIQRHRLRRSYQSIRILVPQSNGIINIDYNKHECVSSKEKEVLIPFPPEINGVGEETPRILGSCDGLIVLANKYPKKPNFTVFNPSTGKSELFAQPERSDRFFMKDLYCSWFGHHPTTGEYVLVICRSHRPEIGLYTFTRENKLRAVQSCKVRREADLLLTFGSHEDRGILLSGAVLWPARWDRGYNSTRIIHIVSGYHIQDNKYFKFSPPSQTDFKLGVMDGYLLSINKRKEDGFFELWLMKETSVWTKYGIVEGGCDAKFVLLSPLSFFHNGDVIMEGDVCILTRYDFNRNKATFLNRYHPPTFGDRLKCKAIVCADSLLSPAAVKEEEPEEL